MNTVHDVGFQSQCFGIISWLFLFESKVNLKNEIKFVLKLKWPNLIFRVSGSISKHAVMVLIRYFFHLGDKLLLREMGAN